MARSKKVDPDLIKQILTLRYSTQTKSQIPKLNWRDFSEKSENNSIDFVERAIAGNIKKNVKNKVSIALSGGVDSTLMLHFLKKTRPGVSTKAILVRFEQSRDETNEAVRIAEKFDIDYEILPIENYLLELPKAISIVKLPLWDLHWYYVAKRAATFSKTILSGDGGDELFGGYTFRYKKFLSLTQKDSSIHKKILAYLQCHERDWVPDQEQIFDKRIRFSWNKIYEIFKPYFNNSLDPLSQVFLADFNGKLRHNFSIVNGSINSYFKLKTLTPLLSDTLINYALHIPSNLKYNKKNDLGKLMLRKILKKEKIERLVSRNKQGFSIDTNNLWRLRARKICDYYLSDSRIIQDKWINPDWINKHLHKSEPDTRYVNKFLGLLALEIWYRLFVTKELKDNTQLSF